MAARRGRCVIGPFALACLDMAGTTVRDDGAVEAAFRTALAAVGIAEGSPRYDEAQAVVRRTMGWSKADVFASLLEPDEAGEATAAFAAAYEAIVATGGGDGDPRRPPVLRDLAPPGVRVCLTTGSRRRPATRCSTPWVGAPRSTWRSPRPTSAGGARRPTCPRRHGPPRRRRPRRSRWWATRSATSRPGTPPVPVRSSAS